MGEADLPAGGYWAKSRGGRTGTPKRRRLTPEMVLLAWDFSTGKGGEMDIAVKIIFFKGLPGNPGMRVDAPVEGINTLVC